MDTLHNLSLVFCGNSAWSASTLLQRKLVFVSSQWDRKNHWTSVDLYNNFLGCVCIVNSESVQAVGLRCWVPRGNFCLLSSSISRQRLQNSLTSLWVCGWIFFSSPLFHCWCGPLLSLLLCRLLLPLHKNPHPLILAWCHTAVASNSPSTSQK